MDDVEQYLNNFDEPQRKELERVRAIIKKVVPNAEESLSYGMPAFKYKNKPLMYYGAFKDHMSIFPTPEPTEMFKEELNDFKVSKGTVRYTLENPIPEVLITKLLRFRVMQIDG